MNGGNKRIDVKNWRHLVVLALLAALFFGGAYWMTTRPAAKAPEEVTVAADKHQPLPDTERGRQVRELLADDSFQTELPEGPKKRPKQQANPMPDWVAKAILYTLVGLGIFTIAVFIWVLVTGNTRLRPAQKVERTRKAPARKPVAAAHALAQHATFEDARAHAAAGNYGEAVRALLAVSLIALSRRELVSLRPWMTGREIVRDARLPDGARAALEGLVFTVEIYAFAGEDVGAETYEACLAHHDLLMQAKTGAS